MDILVVAVIVLILALLVHSLFWAFVFFVAGCVAVGAYRYAKNAPNRRLNGR